LPFWGHLEPDPGSRAQISGSKRVTFWRFQPFPEDVLAILRTPGAKSWLTSPDSRVEKGDILAVSADTGHISPDLGL